MLLKDEAISEPIIKGQELINTVERRNERSYIRLATRLASVYSLSTVCVVVVVLANSYAIHDEFTRVLHNCLWLVLYSACWGIAIRIISY